jgi:hypothetical protein
MADVLAARRERDEVSERFEREAGAVAALNHPDICQPELLGDGVRRRRPGAVAGRSKPCPTLFRPSPGGSPYSSMVGYASCRP